MPTSKMTSKGQTTIPKAVRERLHLEPGDRLDWMVDDHGEVHIRALNLRIEDVAGCLSQYARETPATLEEMDEAISRSIRDRYRRSQE